jgi:hypothetical protein
MRNFIFFIFCCCSFSAFSQDLTGIWRGHFGPSDGRTEVPSIFDRYKFEIQLDQKSKHFAGVTYSYKTTVFYGKATCSGNVDTKTKNVILEEIEIVELRMIAGSACIMTCFLQYSKSEDEEFLRGTYTSISTNDSTNCGGGVVFLRKVPTSDFYKEPFLIQREKEKEEIAKAPVIKKPSTPPPGNTVKKQGSSTTSPKTTKPATSTTSSTVKKQGSSTAAPKSTKPVSSTTSSTVKKPTTATGSPNPNKPTTSTTNSTVKKTVTPKGSSASKPQDKTSSSPEMGKSSTVKIVPADSIKKIEKKHVVTPKVLLMRENELVKTITTSANEITINIYDNGTIDNDTVSVYLDKKLVVAKQRLTEKPISVKFTLDENNMNHELVMVAENLGEIPPNTSLMVVKAGSKQYEVRITSNEQKNAVVIFKYEKEQ